MCMCVHKHLHCTSGELSTVTEDQPMEIEVETGTVAQMVTEKQKI